MRSFDLGQATIKPDQPVEAGAFTTIQFSYTAGHPIDDSGYVKVTFRNVTDFGTPQFETPTAPNYCTVSTTGDCQVTPRWDPKGHTRPWGHALYLKIGSGFLNRGEKITVQFGDRSGGSSGWQMQTFCVRRFEFKTFVDPIATYQFKELPSSPAMPIVPGSPHRAICIAPSQLRINEPFDYFLKLEDRWGNPTGKPRRLGHQGFGSVGVQTLTATDPTTNLSAQSNPILVVRDQPRLNPYWADFHGQTEETVGSNPIEDYFVFARDYGLLDITAHQGNDFQITDAFWEKINEVCREFYKPGVFVTFPGYEWSGNTPLGGDRNVFFPAEGQPITRSSTDLLHDGQTQYKDSPTAADLFKNLAQMEGPRAFGFAHVGGRYADISEHDPDFELAVEVHSAWGTFEWLVEDAFQRGYRVGICANSDGHKCRPGASYPGASTFGSLGGLTCLLAEALDRKAIHEALVARHFYATTGNRCLIDVALTTADGSTAIMGDIIKSGDGVPVIKGRLIGTAPIQHVELRNGLETVKTFRSYGEGDLGRRLKIVWSGAKVRGRDRKVSWDGGLTVEGNEILNAFPINFWNADQPLKKVSKHHLTWKSITTGGLAGVILALKKRDAGLLRIDTAQGQVECDIDSLGLEPKVWTYGGLKKELRIMRLPEQEPATELSFSFPLSKLRHGDNPITVKMVQEDGHMAWTSPVYLLASGWEAPRSVRR